MKPWSTLTKTVFFLHFIIHLSPIGKNQRYGHWVPISQFYWGNIFSLDSKLHKLTVICTVSISEVHLAKLI